MVESYWDKSDSYSYPDSGVLINIPGIRDADALQLFEQRATAIRLDEAMAAIKNAPLTLSTWQKLHKTLFQDVYGWAGELRTVQLAKEHTVFAIPEHVETQANDIFGKLREEALASLSPEALAGRLAYYFAELNVLHPFREGNGRSQKLLFDEIVRQAGYTLNWSVIPPEAFLEALVLAYHSQDYSKVEELFGAALEVEPE